MSLTSLTAVELGKKIKAKEVTVKEALEAVFAQIDKSEERINSYVNLYREEAFQKAEEVQKKIMSMYTDPNHLKVSDPGQVEGNCVFTYLDAFCRDEHFAKYLPDYQNLDELKAHYQRGGLGDVKVKRFLNAIMQEELAPIRARRKELEKRIPEIYEILRKGSIEAEKVAAQTLKEVKESMKINYFDDMELIREQSKRFASEA